MFGLFEICADILDASRENLPLGFERAWLEYCKYFNATAEERTKRFGVSFGTLQLKQGHSRLTAYAAQHSLDAALAGRAWQEFLFSDGYRKDASWSGHAVDGSGILEPVEEARPGSLATSLLCSV